MSLLEHAPQLQAGDAVRIADELYGLHASAETLTSERDQNFLLTGDAGRFVLKIANATESRAFLEAQNAALLRVSRVRSAETGTDDAFVPEPIPTRTGSVIAELPTGNLVRLLRWIEGVPLAQVHPRSPSLLEECGFMLGRIDTALASFSHPALHRRFHWDLAHAFDTTRELLPLVDDNEWRDFLSAEIAGIRSRQAARFTVLRRSAIHGDANDYNILAGGGTDLFTRNQHVRGLIDFGDMVHSFTAAEPAVAIAYAVLDVPNPLDVAASVLVGYHRAHALTEDECKALIDLVRLRLCLSACIAARQQRQRPDDDYLSVSQAPIRRTLPALASIPFRLVQAAVRDACGYPPSPHSVRVQEWLSERDADRSPVLDRTPEVTRICGVDLGVASPLVAGDSEGNAPGKLADRIAQHARDSGATVAAGGYLEARTLYTSPLFDTPSGNPRTIHLGIDLFAPAGTAVRAPLDGIVHEAGENVAPLDYGPVVILRHETDAGDEFFTLYGHLSRGSLEGLHIGTRIGAGQTFAVIGSADVNGGWAPHLHFQLITDLLDLGLDFPGVCLAGETAIWSPFSPDPNLVLNLPASLFPARPVAAATTLARRTARSAPNLGVAYRNPLKIVRGWMQYVFDQEGRRYLDAYNNVPHVGHCHPDVVRAAEAQLRVLNTNTRYLHDSLHEYAERLTATLPEPLRVCYFVNSGSEANELALRLARAHTRRHDVIVVDAAYHGNTTTMTAISPYKFNGPGGEGKPAWVHVAPLPDDFRGPYKRAQPDAAQVYAQHVAEILGALDEAGTPPAAFIAETCPSVAGQIILPAGYLEEVYAGVRHAGGVCIADEVQTAYGRMGSGFYAFEDHSVVPDIVVLGKPIGNGYPIGAVVTTEAIARSFDSGMEFFSTFGGSTVSCAAGRAVLEVVERDGLQRHASDVGSRLRSLLESVAARHEIAADVRGHGFFLGVELVSDRVTLAPAAAEADYVVNRMRERGVLIGTDGPHHNVLKIRPPMSFDVRDAELLVSVLDDVLDELPQGEVSKS